MKNNSFEISKGIDWVLVGTYLVLIVTGIASIFATTYRDENIISGFLSFKTDYSRQLLYFLISAVLAVFILLTDSKFFTATSNFFYAVGLILLILVFPFHTDVKGTESILDKLNSLSSSLSEVPECKAIKRKSIPLFAKTFIIFFAFWSVSSIVGEFNTPIQDSPSEIFAK